MAATKVFDIQPYNSIDSVRVSKAFDVLIYASEDKMLNESQILDFESSK